MLIAACSLIITSVYRGGRGDYGSEYVQGVDHGPEYVQESTIALSMYRV